jgi:hypothetical protein
LQGLLKEESENTQMVQRPGTTEFDIFQTRNLFILKKILRIVSNSRKKNILKESMSDDLTILEEGFLKKEMEKISKTHNNGDILLEFENLYRELVRRKAVSGPSL